MKRKVFVPLASLILTCFISTQASMAATETPAKDAAKVETVKAEKLESAEAKAIMARLEEIKAMDKKSMTTHEKKALRREVKALKTQMAELGGGVYISAGALIVILLLILLL
ncbi:hypothetical protein [Emticicia sp. TH156]|uniref:hypothetical protein n=1 Tax=Emticicia sp. TH156 TaxID=2067454 RepID=UPI000C75BA92|nr:hypothetical protein [Emticicia sp. TH156]PLK44560.1 hypothetical protein C0V77_08790 [Emticicia sp. TH156]